MAALTIAATSVMVVAVVENVWAFEHRQPSVLDSKGLAATTAAARLCGRRSSCSECWSDEKCKWCSGKVHIAVPAVEKKTGYVLGQCVDLPVRCDTIKFGQLDQLQGGGLLTVSWEVVDLKNESLQARQRWCSDVAWPTETTALSCNDCVQQKGGGWCHADVDWSRWFVSMKWSTGICLPLALGMLCNPTLLPFRDIRGMQKFEASWLASSEQCASGLPARPSQPSSICRENRSCKSCGQSSMKCTWCALTGNAHIDIGISVHMPFSLIGSCLEGPRQSCDSIHPGTLEKILPFLTQGSDTWARVASVEEWTSSACSTVEWPSFMLSPSCEVCIAQQDVGWCQVDVLPKAAKSQHSALPAGGVCLDETLQFACKPMLLSGVGLAFNATQWSSTSCGAGIF